MSFFDGWANSPLAGVIGWTLLNSFWQGAIIAAVLEATLLRWRSPRVRYGAACGAMMVLLGGVIFTFFALMPEGGSSVEAVRQSTAAGWHWTTVAGSSAAWGPSFARFVPWLAPFWMAGVLIFSLRNVIGFVSAGQLRRRGVCCAPARWEEELARFARQLRISRPVSLLESCLTEAPVTLGYFCPVILVPSGVLAGFPAAQMEAILLHELAHIRRHDYLMNVLQRVIDALLFYHPAVWWISHVIRAERENCCDDVAVSISGNAHEYARALATLEQTRWHGQEPAVAATGGNLVKRIRRLLYPAGPRAGWAPFLAILVLAATAAAGAAAWRPMPSAMQSDSASTDRYSKWLNEDVVYIIQDAERSAFLKLTTDAERDKFIEQFWERRDPTPSTPVNEFKEEHYRRIDYADQHFGTATMAGWQSDRGHVYIVYGPPDEIDSHPAAGTEYWGYREVKIGDHGQFTFVDQKRNGEYRLQTGPAH